MRVDSIRIRPAVLPDAASIARVHVETWRSAYAGMVPDAYLVGMTAPGQTRFWQREIAARGWAGSVLVADVPEAGEHSVVGFGSCGTLRGRSVAYKAEIYTLYVMTDWQGQGIGEALLVGLFEALLRSGLTSAFLWVLSENPSRFFYEAMDGQRIAERRERFAGAALDETAYGWPDLKRWLSDRRVS